MSPAEKKEAKRLYDIEYRKKNLATIKAKKSAAFQKDYKDNPEKYRAIRKRRSKEHAEYCRRPSYRAKKHAYDRIRYAKEAFGELWEIHVLAMNVAEEAQKKQTKFEMMQSKGTINKALKRRRKYERIKRCELETNSMGNP